MTASNFGKVAKTKVEPSKKLKAILYSNFTTEAVQYGIESEQKAVDLFTREMSKDGITVAVEEPGLSLSKDKPYLGASLDRIVTLTDTDEKWGMEIKSPFSKAGMTVNEACKSKNCFLEKLVDGSVRLKRNHDYFCQVQGQLYCSIMTLKGIFLLCTLEKTCHCLLKRSPLKVADGMMTYYQRLTIFIVGLFSLRCLPNEFSPRPPSSMLCRRCGLCSRRNRKINIVLGGRGENVTKMLKNRILLVSVSTLLSPIVACN